MRKEADKEPEGPLVFGWREWILFERKRKALRAKLDTGARTSCIHAEDIRTFEREGKKWVKFTVFDPNRDAGKVHSVRYECPVVRTARIRNADGHKSERLVVELHFWIGGVQRVGEFSLNTRDDMINPVLIGRKIIRAMGLVDSGRTNLMGRKPKQKPEPKEIEALPPEEDDEED
ncbi:MAG: RimK/LysX family protein [Verrucomicrobia bacterium]|nr:RimK/LysX family protein [Verrucomicrobiota bacterium]MDA1005817.1 RimK/LysX family protein [Verrucomicrobiota bacterium]